MIALSSIEFLPRDVLQANVTPILSVHLSVCHTRWLGRNGWKNWTVFFEWRLGLPAMHRPSLHYDHCDIMSLGSQRPRHNGNRPRFRTAAVSEISDDLDLIHSSVVITRWSIYTELLLYIQKINETTTTRNPICVKNSWNILIAREGEHKTYIHT